MAGQGRTLAILGTVLVAGIGAAIWFAMSSDDDAAGGAETLAADAAPADRAPKPAATASTRPKRIGTAAVFGEIQRSAGKAPIADQIVSLAPERGEPWTATTDAQGAFRFEKIPQGGPYELSAAAKGCATIRLPGIALDRNEERNVGTLYLDPSVGLTVRVRSNADLPIEGAVVEAFAIPQMVDWDWSKALAQLAQTPISVGRASTDAAGQAEFPEMAVGTWTFKAQKEGFAANGAKRVTLRSDQPPLPVTIYLAPGHPLDGRVLGPDKQPVAGAQVTSAPPSSMWDFGAAALRARTTTDAEGRYAFAALETGETQISVARAGGVPAPVATVQVPLVPHFDIVLKGDGVLAGAVTEKETGKPAEGATVRASNWESGSNSTVEAVTDAEGKYSLRMTAGAINRLTVEKSGFVQVRDDAATSAGQQRVATLQEGETATRDLVIRRGAKLSGVVTGPDGPVAGARVTVYSGGRMNEGYQQKSFTTDAAGRYEHAAVDKGTVMVTATKEGHWLPGASENWWQALQSPTDAKELKVDIPETGEVVKDLVLKSGTIVEGTVVGPDGAPLAGVRITAPSALAAPLTGADGAFRLAGVKPGPEAWIYGAKDGYVSATKKAIVVVADQPTTGVTLRMSREPHVRGTVTTASGAPPREARVLVATKASTNDNPWEETQRWQNAARLAVRPDGAFDGPLPTGAAGRLLVRAVSLDQQQTDAKPIDIVEGQDVYEVALQLTEGVELVGTVVAKGGGAGVPGARVSIVQKLQPELNARYGWGAMPVPVWAVTDAAGAFRIPHLSASQFDVRAESEGYVAGHVSANLSEGKPVVVEMSPEMAIEGVVAFADGAPAEGVAVQPQTGGRPVRTFGQMQETQPSATSDAKGFFRLTGIGEGSWSLDVRPQWGSDLNVRSTRVDGVAAGSKGVKITVERGGTISGRIADSQGRAVTSLWINASPIPKPGVATTGNDWRNAQAKPDGTFVLNGLQDGSYRVTFGSNGRGAGYRQVTMDNVVVGTKDLVVVMEEGLSISGVVNDSSGRPVGEMAIQAMSEGGRGTAANTYTDSEGKFTLSGLAAGEYRLMVAQWGSNQAYVFETQPAIAAGSTGVRLVATKGVTISGMVVDEAGAPVGGAFVSGATKTAQKGGQSKGDGTFEIVGLEAGQTYRLAAQAQGRVSAQLEDVGAGAKDVRIVLAKGLEASGKLFDAAGKVLPMTQLWMTSADGKQGQSAQTDATGRFTVSGLAEGNYDAKVMVKNADGKNEWKSAGTVKGGDRDVDLRMP